MLQVFDLFQSFGIPVLQFVCAGWSERAQMGRDGTGEPDGAKARLASFLHFHDGPPRDLMLDGMRHRLDRNGNAALVDAVIATEDADALARIEAELGPGVRGGTVCDWGELRDLQRQGMTIGCHSVSHPRIARQSAVRQRFEIAESRRLVEARLGPSPWFAYPYGTPESHDAGTRALIAEQGFALAFTTVPALAAPGQDHLRLPRIVLPDVAMTDTVFRARVRGGGIPLAAIRGIRP
jgi:peptidoglycan/xylan/chitin deacetylase (PgdA/CDA1 family)